MFTNGFPKMTRRWKPIYLKLVYCTNS